jgi:ActR/RegA family two-component response regulator
VAESSTRVVTPSGAKFSRRAPLRPVTDTTILLVEDDRGLRTFLADNLTADGFDVLVADTVRDAVRLLEYKQPDLALIDLGLPDGSGLDLIARVRAADGVASRLDPGVPLVVLTGGRASSIGCAASRRGRTTSL